MQRMLGPATVFSGLLRSFSSPEYRLLVRRSESPICISLYKMVGEPAVTLVSGLCLFWVADTKSIAGQFPTPTSRTLG